MVRTHRSPSVWSSVSLVAIVAGLLLGLVRHETVNASGGQTLSGSGPYRLVENWPEAPPDDPRFGSMSGVAVANGVVYGLNRDRGTVWMWASKSGRYLGSWGPGVTVLSHDMEYDRHEGVIWVTDRSAHTVKKYSLEGELLMTLGHFEEPGWGPGHFNGPSDIAVAPNGDLFVADGYWNQRLVKFNKDGRYLGEMGTPGRARYQFGLPHHIASTDSGRLFITDLCGYGPGTTGAASEDSRRAVTGRDGGPSPIPGRFPCPGSRVVVVDHDMNWLDEWPTLGSFFVRGNTLYVWQDEQGLALIDANTGDEIGRIAVENPTTSAHQFVLDEDGDLYTADMGIFDTVDGGPSGWSFAAQRLGAVGSIKRYTRSQ